MFLLQNLHTLQAVPEALNTGIFKDVFHMGNVANMSLEEQLAYWNSLKLQWDNYSIRRTAERMGHEEGFAKGQEAGFTKGQEAGFTKGHEEGIEQGIEQGKAEGEAQKEEQLILSMLKRNYPVEEIAQIATVSKAHVIQVKSKHGL